MDEDEGGDEEVEIQFYERIEVDIELAIDGPAQAEENEDGEADVAEENPHIGRLLEKVNDQPITVGKRFSVRTVGKATKKVWTGLLWSGF